MNSPDEPPLPGEDDRKIAALDQSHFREEAMVRLESLNNFAQSLWKGLMIVNGGAIVALFTFIGNTSQTVDRSSLWWAFLWFAAGLGTALLSNLAAYVTQSAYWRQNVASTWNAQEQMHGRRGKWNKDIDRDYRIGSWTEYVAFGAAIIALASFIGGSWCALSAVLPPVPQQVVSVRSSTNDPVQTASRPKAPANP